MCVCWLEQDKWDLTAVNISDVIHCDFGKNQKLTSGIDRLRNHTHKQAKSNNQPHSQPHSHMGLTTEYNIILSDVYFCLLLLLFFLIQFESDIYLFAVCCVTIVCYSEIWVWPQVDPASTPFLDIAFFVSYSTLFVSFAIIECPEGEWQQSTRVATTDRFHCINHLDCNCINCISNDWVDVRSSYVPGAAAPIL